MTANSEGKKREKQEQKMEDESAPSGAHHTHMCKVNMTQFFFFFFTMTHTHIFKLHKHNRMHKQSRARGGKNSLSQMGRKHGSIKARQTGAFIFYMFILLPLLNSRGTINIDQTKPPIHMRLHKCSCDAQSQMEVDLRHRRGDVGAKMQRDKKVRVKCENTSNRGKERWKEGWREEGTAGEESGKTGLFTSAARGESE